MCDFRIKKRRGQTVSTIFIASFIMVSISYKDRVKKIKIKRHLDLFCPVFPYEKGAPQTGVLKYGRISLCKITP